MCELYRYFTFLYKVSYFYFIKLCHNQHERNIRNLCNSTDKKTYVQCLESGSGLEPDSVGENGFQEKKIYLCLKVLLEGARGFSGGFLRRNSTFCVITIDFPNFWAL